MSFDNILVDPAYVLDSRFGNDVVNEIHNCTQHPYEESRTIRDNSLIEELDHVYYEYREDCEKRIQSLNRNIGRHRDFEYKLEVQEMIADIYYDINNVSYEELMKFKPKIRVEDLKEYIR